MRATIARIRDEFAAAAKRQDRHGTARLVRIDVCTIADPSLALPSLEAFAESRGLKDFAQADQVAYMDVHGRPYAKLSIRDDSKVKIAPYIRTLIAAFGRRP